jgi:hypothetical protein
MPILFSKEERVAIAAYPDTHDIAFPNKVVPVGRGKPMASLAMSYTKLKDYSTCPRMFYKKHLTGMPFESSPALEWGKRVHSAYENFVLHDTPIPTDVEQKSGSSVPQMIKGQAEKLSAEGALLVPVFGEQEWAIDFAGRCARWRDGSGVFMRGKADIGYGARTMCFIGDYKTGKGGYPDTDQLDALALLATAQPQLKCYGRVTGALLFVEADKLVMKETDTSTAGRLALLKDWQSRALEVVTSYEQDRWVEKSSGLCGWCPDTDCPHNTKVC